MSTPSARPSGSTSAEHEEPRGNRLLGAATYGFLFNASLVDSLAQLADAGIKLVELTASPPHVQLTSFGQAERRSLRQRLATLDLRLVSINPTYLDINLCSLNDLFRKESIRQLTEALRLCHDLGGEMLVLFAGRRHVLAPAPMTLVEPRLLDGLETLLEEAERLGVTVALENGPTLVAELGSAIARLCAHFDGRLRAVYDVANARMVEDVVIGLEHALAYVELIHLSDTTPHRWQHAAVGQGDVDFPAVAQALDRTGYRGPSIMEIVDLDRPLEALVRSASVLTALGWVLQRDD